MEIVSSRNFIKKVLKENTFQTEFPEEETCKCGHRMIPVFSLVDDEGIFLRHRPGELNEDEFWFHDSVAMAVYLCVTPTCGKMKTLWNQA